MSRHVPEPAVDVPVRRLPLWRERCVAHLGSGLATAFGGDGCAPPGCADATHERLGQPHPGQQVDGVAGGQLGEQVRDLVKRGTAPQAGVGIDPEVQPL